MKLYYVPGYCSLAPHIAFREAHLDVTVEKVDTKEQRTEAGADYRNINPKGYVPALQLDNGEFLTEAAVILQYLADRKPESKLLPAQGTMERVRVQEMLNFIATELHKGFGPLFNPNAPEETRKAATTNLSNRLNFLNKHLEGKDYVMGNQFTVADAYLFTVLGWAPLVKFDLAPWPNVVAVNKRIGARPAVQAALKSEGLLK